MKVNTKALMAVFLFWVTIVSVIGGIIGLIWLGYTYTEYMFLGILTLVVLGVSVNIYREVDKDPS